MAIDLTGNPGGLFRRIGRVGKIAQIARVYQGTTLPTDILTLMAQYDTLRTAVDGVPTADTTSRKAVSQIMSTLATSAQTTLALMVKSDKPNTDADVTSQLTELINQMRTAVASVKKQTVTASSAAFSTPVANAGNGTLAITKTRGDGLDQENIIPETAYAVCTSDSQSGGATLGQEIFTYTGAIAQTDVWAEDFPIGDGGTLSLTAADATLNNSGGNLLTNGFETFTSNAPDNWAVLVGVAGTDFQKSTAQFFNGVASLQYIGGATLTSLAQTFNLAGGTAGTLVPDTSYAVNFWAKFDVVPAAGVLTVDLVDGTNTVINDDNGVANSQTFTLSTFSTSFVAKNLFFRTPRSLPATIKIRVRISTALSGGSNLFMDNLAMAPASALYAGGPLAVIFSGQTTAKFVAGDGFILTTTNDYGGSANLSTFQQLFQRIFDMRSKGLLLPSNAAPTIADTLITT